MTKESAAIPTLQKLCDQLSTVRRTKFLMPGTGQNYSYVLFEDVSAYIEEARAALSVSPVPVPGPILSWQERYKAEHTYWGAHDEKPYMAAEIADLRAAVAAVPGQSEPVGEVGHVETTLYKRLPAGTKLYAQSASVSSTTSDAAELAEWRRLKDPAVLHVSLLKGLPARLTPDQLRHIAGDFADGPVVARPDLRDTAIANAARTLSHKYFNGGIRTSADICEFWEFIKSTDATTQAPDQTTGETK